MDPMSRTAIALLDRHPAPALSLDRLKELLAQESATCPEEDGLLRSLVRVEEGVHVVRSPRRRWASRVGPSAWILSRGPRAGGQVPRRSVPGILRDTLTSLGRAVEPGSAAAWARWSRLVAEEGRVREALRHRSRRKGVSAPSPVPPRQR